MVVRWGLYPFSWLITLSGITLFLHDVVEPKTAWVINAGILASLYLVIERVVPYEKRWSMTMPSFISDIKFAAINSGFITGLSAALALFTISISGNNQGMASEWPPLVQLIACFLIFEAFNYSLHRTMHEAKGTLGKFLWRVHAAHHLPPRLYLIMHAVFHPINGIIIAGLAIIMPIWLVGYSQEVVTMFFMINGLHGLISHFNVDIRMGWFNYILVGPELHRYHHSADVNEAKNYGATLSVYDQLFGTFVYHPGTPPEQLGVSESAGFPDYDRTMAVLKLPFSK